MNIDINAIVDAIASHAAASGYFEQVNLHVNRVTPGQGLRAAVWYEGMSPVSTRSGLASVSAQLRLHLRMYQQTAMEPYDMIDPSMVTAMLALMSAYSGDFELGGTATQIDLFGAYGEQLGSSSGWVEYAGSISRVIDIMIPVIVDDVWTEVA